LLLETMLVLPDQPRIPQQNLYLRNAKCLRCLQIVKTFHLSFGMRHGQGSQRSFLDHGHFLAAEIGGS
jgi:hypothetical protein